MFLQKEILNAIMQMPRSILDLPLHGPPMPGIAPGKCITYTCFKLQKLD